MIFYFILFSIFNLSLIQGGERGVVSLNNEEVTSSLLQGESGITGERDRPHLLKKKNPTTILLMNLLPITLIPLSTLITFAPTETDFSLAGSALVISTGIVLPFGTIPAHIAANTPLSRIFVLTLLKSFWGIPWVVYGIHPEGSRSNIKCLMECLSEKDACYAVNHAFTILYLVSTLIMGGIYTYEIIAINKRVIEYNKEVEKQYHQDKEEKSEFFFQPFLRQKGELFITGGIRF